MYFRNRFARNKCPAQGLRRRSVAICAVAAFCAAAFAVLPGAVHAAYQYTGETFGTEADGTNVFSTTVRGVAVDEASGDIYVADPNENRITRFTAAGEFIEAWGWGVGGGSGFEHCTASCQRGAPGEGVGQFRAPIGVAVDQTTGDVFVLSYERAEGVVQEFTEDGAYLQAFGKRGEASAEEVQEILTYSDPLTVDSAGNVYVADNGGAFGPRVLVFAPSGAGGAYEYDRAIGVGATEFEDPETLAVDDQGDLFVSNEFYVYKFDPGGSLEWIYEEPSFTLQGMTVNPSSGEVIFYGAAEEEFHQLSSSGELVASFAGHDEEETKGLALNATGSLPGRQPGILYATDTGGFGGTARGLIFAEPPAVAPVISSEVALEVGEESARLSAQVNPKGNATSYVFEYGTAGPCSASPCATSPLGGGELGSGTAPRTAGASISGLQAGTTYFYRVVATNAAGPAYGEDRSFVTFPASAAGLPDGRSYEMVSPPSKSNGEVVPPEPTGGPEGSGGFLGGSCEGCKPGGQGQQMSMQASDDGDSIAFVGQPFFAGVGSGLDEYLGTRSTGGWQTVGLTSPLQGLGESQGFKALSGDLSRGVVLQKGAALSPLAPVKDGLAYNDLYLWSAAEGYRPLVTAAPPNRAPGKSIGTDFEPLLVGGNEGGGSVGAFTHVAFEANDALTAATDVAPAALDPGAGSDNLYEWVGGELRLVNVLPGNATTSPDAVGGSGQLLGKGQASPDFDHAISDDGSRIFWTDTESGRLFVREDGATTVEVPDPGRCTASLPLAERVCFLTASADGSRVLLSDGHLFDLPQGGPPVGVDLTSGLGGFQGILGSSEDLSTVYFVATSRLADGERGGEHAETGADNLYVWREGAVAFIARLTPADNHGGGAEGAYGAWKPSPADRSAQVTPDGAYLAFMSRAELTGYDNERRGGGLCGGETSSCPEVFEYAVASNSLACASCNPTGQQPIGASNLSLIEPPGPTSLRQPHNLVSVGRLFFESRDALSPRDVNGVRQDVYEFEPAGPDGCALAKGCISLISTGHSTADSDFVDATPSGDDVFFVTRQQLVPQDTDDLLDLYDARVGGGIATVGGPSPCSGEACRGTITPSPTTGSPASSSVSASGNQRPKPSCRRGFVRRHGGCVRRRHRKRRHHDRGGHHGKRPDKVTRHKRRQSSSGRGRHATDHSAARHSRGPAR